MGQYFKPTILKDKWENAKYPVVCSLHPFDFGDNGMKLMEHSYAGNMLVLAACHLLANAYYNKHFVWLGDYADINRKRKYHYRRGDKDVANLYSLAGEVCKTKKVQDYARSLDAKDIPQYAYAINFTKGEYVKLPKFNKKEYRIHPLPLLTSDGNGYGGGDYTAQIKNYDYEEDERIGSWAYDCIGVTNSKKAIEGLKRIDGFFPMDR